MTLTADKEHWHKLADLRSAEICRLTAENKALTERIEKLEITHQEEIFRLNNKCVAMKRRQGRHISFKHS